MKTKEERADNFLLSQGLVRGACASQIDYGARCMYDGYIQGDADRKAIDKELIEMLIDELYTSRAYHLGITGLDSGEEIKRKTIEGDCALIRGIDRTIKYVKEAMKE